MSFLVLCFVPEVAHNVQELTDFHKEHLRPGKSRDLANLVNKDYVVPFSSKARSVFIFTNASSNVFFVVSSFVFLFIFLVFQSK